MSKKIVKLTPEQEQLLTTQREHWLQVGLSTEPADRAEAERGVRLAYEAVKLPHPQFIIWADSPYAGAWAQAIAPGIIKQCVGKGAQVWDQVGAQVWDQVRDQVRDQVGDQVGDQVRAQVWDQVRDRLNRWTDGVVDTYWGVYYSSWFDTMRKLGVEHLEPWEGQQTVAGNAFWWWCFKEFSIICERPTVLTRDPQNRLHNETGPAMQWPDGWSLHSWHGTRVPADLIETGWTTDQILKEPNSEIRRCAIERMGWAQFITEAKLKQVGSVAADPANPGYELSLYDIPEQIYGTPVRVLLCANATIERDGTRRRFGLTVPATVRTPVAAAAWTFDLSETDYSQLAAAC